MVSPLGYWSGVVLAALACIALCGFGRRFPGPWRSRVADGIGVLLIVDAVAYTVGLIVARTWSPETSLPLALCNVGVIVAALACLFKLPLLVELTYFWGLAGTLQAVVTPDLSVGFPHLVFFEYLGGHVGIVLAALFLVVGCGLHPRSHAVRRVFVISAGYTALVGLVDATAGANYMFLRRPPSEWTLLRVLGPWPWYVVSAAGVALLLFVLLDVPFWRHRGAGLGEQGDDVAGSEPSAGKGVPAEPHPTEHKTGPADAGARDLVDERSKAR